MSNKFEQLLDYLINEEIEKANELFHEIVVEKSREIYENLIAQESADEEEMDESEDSDEAMDESEDCDEEMGESQEELEDSYQMMDAEGDDEEEVHDFAPGDKTDDFGADTMSGDDSESEESEAIQGIKNAIEEIEAAFAQLQMAHGETPDEFGADDDFPSDNEFNVGVADSDAGDDDEDGDESTDEMMGQPAFESKRMTREYVEKVGNDWEKSGSMKAQGQYAGAGTGEKDGAPVEGKSPVSAGKGKPTTGADAKNILGSVNKAGEGVNTGTKPTGKAGGLSPEKGEFAGSEWKANSAPGGKAGVKNLKKQGAGYPGNNKTPGAVGSGTGDKAGQTSVGKVQSPINGAPDRNK